MSLANICTAQRSVCETIIQNEFKTETMRNLRRFKNELRNLNTDLLNLFELGIYNQALSNGREKEDALIDVINKVHLDDLSLTLQGIAEQYV